MRVKQRVVHVHHKHLVVPNTSQDILMFRMPIHVLAYLHLEIAARNPIVGHARTPTTEVCPLNTVVGSMVVLALEYDVTSLA